MVNQKKQNIRKRNVVSDLSDARTCLMGYAILIVVVYHTWGHIDSALPYSIDRYFWLGYSGCDIFMLLSGFGLAHSLAKDVSFSKYMGRRAARIFPSYYPFILVYLIAIAATRELTLPQVFGNLTFTGFWIGMSRQFNWYVQAMVAFWLLAPVIAWIFRELGNGWRTGLILIVGCVVVQILYWGEHQMIAASRVPVFLIGFCLAKCKPETITWNKKWMIAALAGFFGGFWIQNRVDPYITWGNGLYWYPFILIAPAFCLIVAALRPYCLKCKVLYYLDKAVCLLGTCSFEIYLIHDLIIEWFPHEIQGNFQWALAATSCVLVAIGYHFLVEYVVRLNKSRKAFVG